MDFFTKTNICLILSLLFSVAFLVVVVFPGLTKRFSKLGKFGLLIFDLAAAIWLVLLIIYPSVIDFTAVIGCLVETIKMFKIDTDYYSFIAAGEIIGRTLFVKSYLSFLYLAAPVTSSIVIFEILADILPSFQLFIKSKLIWKEVIYISRLDNEMLSLAKSAINCKNIFTRPIVVFADKAQASQELVASAKMCGAICIKNDILHISFRRLFKKKIIIADGADNLHIFTSIINKRKGLYNTELYIFCDDSVALDCETIMNKVTGKKLLRTRIITVNPKRNLIRNLLSDVPLYDPLVSVKDKKELNITVFGAGNIGTEMFLSSYWYGQIFGYDLCLNVVSREEEREFIERIAHINSELWDTCVRIKPLTDAPQGTFEQDGKTSRFKDIMKIYKDKEETAKPYFKFRYLNTDFQLGDYQGKIINPQWEDGFKLTDTDYFVVSAGGDAFNFKIASDIKKALVVSGKQQNTVISYLITDPDLCRTFNKDALDKNIYMNAFGSTEDTFNVKNIFMSATVKDSKIIKDEYEKIAKNITESNFGNKLYDYWADIARALHIKYKVFSAGFIDYSVFNKKESNNKNDIESYKAGCDKNAMAWLEHRRWCAFMRVCGFKAPYDVDKFYETHGSHKNLDLKLHCCLTETNGVFTEFNTDGYASDRLDYVGTLASRNFKGYDLPEKDFPGEGK
ncbi:MAG: hypothetical protein J6V58_04775 [Clostridia bacterium]|nr:hypothetical protein [Clostridia bacterium]